MLSDGLRNTMPKDRRDLYGWVKGYTGLTIPHRSVCRGHTSPFDLFSRQVLERPPIALWCGPRGSGKSFVSALDTHVSSRFHQKHQTRILGGSMAQSEQVYGGLKDIRDRVGPLGTDADSIATLLKTECHYRNGSYVSILAASAKSVRGPHIPSLKLDEVDEIDPELREAAMGMNMQMHGVKASCLMTSTWHRLGGPMSDLMERGKSGLFPVDTFCVFEVLETCPEERSGKDLEKCPECPLIQWCHAGRDEHPSGLPKAKRSNGHYAIDSLIQKANTVSSRVFGSDYLCERPRASGVWFTTFDDKIHVSESAEYSRNQRVHLSVDSGVHTGAVWFQVALDRDGIPGRVSVFADYYTDDSTQHAEERARYLVQLSDSLCGVGVGSQRVSCDPASHQRTASGHVVQGEYERAGLKGANGLENWPYAGHKGTDGLELIEALLMPASRTPILMIHPRCTRLIAAFQSYERAKKNNQLLDYPKDPQHPHEEMIDSLAGGLRLEFPAGRRPKTQFKTVHASKLA